MTAISDISHQYLAAWFSQRPTCALLGEFSAGKSTLLNLLLGRSLLPTRVTATNMPPVWLTHGEEETGLALFRDGRAMQFNMTELQDQAERDPLLLRVSLNAPVLQGIDIIDTPGISDPRLAAGALKFLYPYLDFVIWCSGANQAWRQTEKSTWLSFPESLRRTSILALTRADTLRSDEDLRKVLKRCHAETKDLFQHVVPLSTTAAISASGALETEEGRDKWKASYASAFYAILDGAAARATADCMLRPEQEIPALVEFQDIENDVSENASHDDPGHAGVAIDSGASATIEKLKESVTESENYADFPALMNGLKSDLLTICRDTETKSKNDQILDRIDHFSDKVQAHKELSKEHRVVVDRMCNLNGLSDLNEIRVVLQMVREIEDFAVAPWKRLDQAK